MDDLPSEVLAGLRECRRTADRAEADLLVLVAQWTAMHPVDSIHEPAIHLEGGYGEADLALGGQGCPTVAEYAIPELAAALGRSTDAGRWLVGDVLELVHRLPRLWARVQAGSVVPWRARRIARETLRLSPEAAQWVDIQVAPVARRVGPVQLDRLVNHAIGTFMPDEVQRLADASWDKRHVTLHDQQVSFTGTMHLDAELDIADALDLEAAVAAAAAQRADLGSTESLDVRRSQALGDLARGQAAIPFDLGEVDEAAPRTRTRKIVLHVHLSRAAIEGRDAVAGLERGNALIAADHVKAWCARPDSQVVVQPVIDLDACVATDTYSVPTRIKQHVALRDGTCAYPWCTRPARATSPRDDDEGGDRYPCDNDHVVPHAHGGVTCSCNLAPLCRRHHRLKTHSTWRYTVIDPGTYLWTSPHGYQFLRDPTGTIDVTPGRPHPPPQVS